MAVKISIESVRVSIFRGALESTKFAQSSLPRLIFEFLVYSRKEHISSCSDQLGDSEQTELLYT